MPGDLIARHEFNGLGSRVNTHGEKLAGCEAHIKNLQDSDKDGWRAIGDLREEDAEIKSMFAIATKKIDEKIELIGAEVAKQNGKFLVYGAIINIIIVGVFGVVFSIISDRHREESTRTNRNEVRAENLQDSRRDENFQSNERR